MDNQMAGSAAPDEAVNDAQQEVVSEQDPVVNNTDQSVQHTIYKRTVAKLKNWQSRAENAEQKFSDLEERLLEAEGKKDELIKKLQEKVTEKDKKVSELAGNFAYSSVSSQLQAHASGAGCIDVNALSKLIDLSTVSVDDETFRADEEALKNLVDDAKKNMPYLFSKSGPKINTQVPGGAGQNFDEKKVDYSKMSADDLIAEAERLDGIGDKKPF